MIKHVIQIADIHIPNNEKERPYMEMLKMALAELLRECKRFEKDEFRIVLCGDIFDKKIKVTNEARKMLHEMLNYLNAIGKVIIIAGNHDMLENNHDRIDSLSPTFDIMNVYPNITYADKVLNYESGFIKDDNVIWVLYSMFDEFNRPNVSELKEKYPDSKIIGLFHGDLNGAVTDSGRMTENGVVADIFDGCDCVMAGHIHKYQTIKKNGIPIVYSSSLFQKDCGENTTGHGFVIWDLETLEHHLVEVTNNYKTYKFKIKDYEDIKEDRERLINL